MVIFKLKRVIGYNERTQTWLAQSTGIRPTTISNICNNHIKSLPVDVIDKICKALDCTPADWILYYPDEG